MLNNNLTFLCACVGNAVFPTQRNMVIISHYLDQNIIDWDSLVALADSYLVPTAFGIGLMKHPRSYEAPEEFLEFLKALIDCNRERNNNIIQQYGKLKTWLGAENILPMKGVALILNETYQDHAVRILSDIDILVPTDKLYYFANLLKDHGYSVEPETESEYLANPVHHHYPGLIHSAFPCGVELHSRVSSPAGNQFLHAEELWAPLETQSPKNAPLTHLYLHTLAHGYLSDLTFCKSGLDLRHSLDLATLDSVFKNQIDYDFIEQRLSSYGYKGFSAFHRSLSQVLFGKANEQHVKSRDLKAKRYIRKAVFINKLKNKSPRLHFALTYVLSNYCKIIRLFLVPFKAYRLKYLPPQ